MGGRGLGTARSVIPDARPVTELVALGLLLGAATGELYALALHSVWMIFQVGANGEGGTVPGLLGQPSSPYQKWTTLVLGASMAAMIWLLIP